MGRTAKWKKFNVSAESIIRKSEGEVKAKYNRGPSRKTKKGRNAGNDSALIAAVFGTLDNTAPVKKDRKATNTEERKGGKKEVRRASKHRVEVVTGSPKPPSTSEQKKRKRPEDHGRSAANTGVFKKLKIGDEESLQDFNRRVDEVAKVQLLKASTALSAKRKEKNVRRAAEKREREMEKKRASDIDRLQAPKKDTVHFGEVVERPPIRLPALSSKLLKHKAKEDPNTVTLPNSRADSRRRRSATDHNNFMRSSLPTAFANKLTGKVPDDVSFDSELSALHGARRAYALLKLKRSQCTKPAHQPTVGNSSWSKKAKKRGQQHVVFDPECFGKKDVYNPRTGESMWQSRSGPLEPI